MALTGDDHFILDINAAPKDVTQGTGDPTATAGDDDISIWINTVDVSALGQSIVGCLHQVHNFIQSENLKDAAIETWAAIPIGGADNDIVATAPGAGEVGVLIGATTAAGNRSHFLDRTFKRLIEKLLEAGKGV